MRRPHLSGAATALLAWTVAMALFFPVAWMIVTGFKTEEAAVSAASLLRFAPTLDTYIEMFAQHDYLGFALNSVIIALGATAISLGIGLPAAYAMAFHPRPSTRGLLLWMLSTKMLPPVGVLVPIYLIYRTTGLLDTRIGLIAINALMNLPIVVWMLFAFFKDVPREILEAGRVDGARWGDEIQLLLLPMAAPGIASTCLLSVILCWNEGFWSLNLTAAGAAPLTAFIAAFSSPEGFYFAKLSAASTVAVAPIVVLGWLGQRQMVRGLTFGAVK